jgi:hypothetical protein
MIIAHPEVCAEKANIGENPEEKGAITSLFIVIMVLEFTGIPGIHTDTHFSISQK